MNFTELTCSNCGGNLQQVENSNRWKCVYCGVERLVDNSTVSQPAENLSHQKAVSDLRAETRELLMEVVLAVGAFTSLYPNWQFSQWLDKEKGQAGELGAYRGVFWNVSRAICQSKSMKKEAKFRMRKAWKTVMFWLKNYGSCKKKLRTKNWWRKTFAEAVLKNKNAPNTACTRRVGVTAFFGSFLAGGWFRQNSVLSSRPPAGNAHR